MDTLFITLITIGIIGLWFNGSAKSDTPVTDAIHTNHVVHTHADEAFLGYTSLAADTTEKGKFPYQKTEAEWKQILTDKEFRILREAGTELPWANEYYDNKKPGIYVCAGCGQQLYSSEHKYKSGTGWPSFWKPISPEAVAEQEDNSWFMSRIEIVCSNCGGHIGHVFDDGPQPTGLRYCMNSAAMNFIPDDE